jgi:hypothetical protein
MSKPVAAEQIQQNELARENPAWGYERIAGAVRNLGHRISDQTEGNIFQRHGLGSTAAETSHTCRAPDDRRQPPPRSRVTSSAASAPSGVLTHMSPFDCDTCGEHLAIDEAGAAITIDCAGCGKKPSVCSRRRCARTVAVAPEVVHLAPTRLSSRAEQIQQVESFGPYRLV